MRRGSKNLIHLVGCIALASGIEGSAFGADEASTSNNPYHAIMERNVFDLKPPPPQTPPPPVVPPTPPPNVKFTGTTSILGKPRALFMVQKAPTPGKPPVAGANQDESVILSVGERQGSLELLEIDMKEGTAKIRNDGTEVVLTLPTGPPSGGGGPGGPGGAPAPFGGQQQPPRMPTFIPQPQAPGAPRGFPGTPQGNSSAGSSYGNSTAMASGIGNGNSMAGALGTVDNGLNNLQRDPRTTPVDNASLEEKMLMLEGNRIMNANNPNMPPLPPPAPGVAELLGQGQSAGDTSNPNSSLTPQQQAIQKALAAYQSGPTLSRPSLPGLPPGGH